MFVSPSTVMASEANKCKLAVPAASAKRPCWSMVTTSAETLEKVVSASDRVEHKVKIELVTAIGQLQPIGDQRLTHTKHSFRCQIRIVFAKDVGDQGFVARGLDLEMQMCGSPRVPGSGFQQLPNRPIVRDGVGHGQDGLEVKAHMSIRCEYPLGLVLRPVGVLHVVQAFLIGLPNLVLSCATASPCTPLTLP